MRFSAKNGSPPNLEGYRFLTYFWGIEHGECSKAAQHAWDPLMLIPIIENRMHFLLEDAH